MTCSVPAWEMFLKYAECIAFAEEVIFFFFSLLLLLFFPRSKGQIKSIYVQALTFSFPDNIDK